MFLFCSIDATADTGHPARLINHSRLDGNCEMRISEHNDKPLLFLRATRTIEVGEEFLYDYGDRSRQSIADFPFLAM